ncbi:hypothetical protein TWF970_010208 [Orbilia oligospora]|uniref:Uncharacterized protein n=1 Tax=Orbilia oligospora TaxID=2813651 RepID=A0A7C8R2D1_ORBOL|nr:hypothetical protein TWF970_010208 [Orbilia oligospora]
MLTTRNLARIDTNVTPLVFGESMYNHPEVQRCPYTPLDSVEPLNDRSSFRYKLIKPRTQSLDSRLQPSNHPSINNITIKITIINLVRLSSPPSLVSSTPVITSRATLLSGSLRLLPYYPDRPSILINDVGDEKTDTIGIKSEGNLFAWG